VHDAVEIPAAFNMIHTALVVKVDIVVRKETESSTARALVVASILTNEPEASPERIREGIFLRFYGRDFDEATRDRIAVSLARPVEATPGQSH
jgi:hypothetical protein